MRDISAARAMSSIVVRWKPYARKTLVAPTRMRARLGVGRRFDVIDERKSCRYVKFIDIITEFVNLSRAIGERRQGVIAKPSQGDAGFGRNDRPMNALPVCRGGPSLV